MLRHLGQFQRTGAVDDDLLVDSDPGQRRDRRPRRDHDILRAHGLATDLDAILAGEARATLKPRHLVLLEQILDAAGQLLDRVAALAVHRVEIEFDAGRLDAHLGHGAIRQCIEIFGRVQHRLRRNTADVEAGAAQRLAVLGARRLQPELCCADRGDIATGAGTNYEDVIVVLLFVSHCLLRPRAEAGVQLRAGIW